MLDPGTCLCLAIGLRYGIEPAHDFLLSVEAPDEGVHVLLAPRTQRHDTVGERRSGSGNHPARLAQGSGTVGAGGRCTGGSWGTLTVIGCPGTGTFTVVGSSGTVTTGSGSLGPESTGPEAFGSELDAGAEAVFGFASGVRGGAGEPLPPSV